MDIEGTVSKLLTPLEKHSSLIGAGLAGLYYLKGGQWQDDIGKLMNGEVHFPDITEIYGMISDPTFMGPAAVSIMGWLLKDATSNSMVKKIAGIAQDGGLGFVAVVVAQRILSSMTHSDGHSGNAGSTGNRGYGY